MPTPLLGLQLYSLRREFGLDAEGSLRQIRALGYDFVEMAGTYGWDVEHWRELLKETGLQVAGAHIGLRELTEDLEAQVEFQAALGNHRYVVPYLPPEFHTLQGFAEIGRRLNDIAERLKKHGASLYYHNHDFEFKPLGTSRGFDLLVKNTDPALVHFEVDTYWIERTGLNAADFVARHAGRIGMIHAKEFRRRDKTDRPAGEGDIDFPSIIALAKSKGWPVIAEFEGEGALEASRKSAIFLRSLLF